MDVLLDVLANGTLANATRSVGALTTYRHDLTVGERATLVAEARTDVASLHRV